jgi:transposase-like protein
MLGERTYKPRVIIKSKFLDRLRSSIKDSTNELKFFKSCPRCGGKLVKNGKRKLKYRKPLQRFLCKSCKKSFCENDFPYMKFPKEVVFCAVDLYIDGLSLARVRYRVSKIFCLVVKSASTIWYWVQRFAQELKNVISGLGRLLHADETKIKTNKKNKYFWFWAMKCSITKAIVGWWVSTSRSEEEAKKLFQSAQQRFPLLYYPEAIRTDSLRSYYPAIRKVFGYKVRHDKFISFKEHSNNEIENFFRCKHRFPRFRKIESARAFIAHWLKEYELMKGISKIFYISSTEF